MKVITILSQKGGAGKTTLALHLAVAAARSGLSTTILDADPQRSATGWKDGRQEEAPAVTAVEPGGLAAALGALAGGTRLVVIDTAPHLEPAALAAAAAADLILVPCRAGILDLRAIGATAEIVRSVGKPAFAVLNQTPPRAPRLVEDASQAIGQHGLDVCPVILHQRAAYAHALTVSETAGEFEPGGKAGGEVEQLFAWARTLLHL